MRNFYTNNQTQRKKEESYIKWTVPKHTVAIRKAPNFKFNGNTTEKKVKKNAPD